MLVLFLLTHVHGDLFFVNLVLGDQMCLILNWGTLRSPNRGCSSREDFAFASARVWGAVGSSGGQT